MAFDARSILDALVRGSGGPQSPQGGASSSELDSISDIFRKFGGQGPGADARPPSPPTRPMPQDAYPPTGREPARNPQTPDDNSDAGGGGGLQDILRDILGGGSGGRGGGGSGGGGGSSGGGLDDILEQLKRQMGQGGAGGGGGGLGDILGQIFGQGRGPGPGPGASQFADVPGARQLADVIAQATGRNPEELLAQVKDFIANNQFGTGAALGGLGGLLLGTRAGRTLATHAVKLGGLAVIGGLAYRAYQSYQQGHSATTTAGAPQQQLLAAPEGSGFEPSAMTHESAITLVRAMIAAAAADGRVDANEQRTILGELQQAGLGGEAQDFLAQEVRSPASVDELTEAVSSPEEAVQVYTAARLAVDMDNRQEHDFLVSLAEKLGIDANLATHIDAAARNVSA